MKAVKILICTVTIMFSLSAAVYAKDASVPESEYLKDYGTDELYDSLDSELRSSLEALGIDEISFSAVNSVKPSDIFNVIKDIISGKSNDVLKSAVILMCIITAIAAAESFITDDSKMKETVENAGVLLCVSILCVPLTSAVKSAVAGISVCCTFIKTLIPVMTGVIIAAGSPMSAATFQTFAFAAAQFISSAAGAYAVPLTGSVMALDVTGALLPQYDLDGITSFIKKVIIWTLSFASTMYIAFLSVKDILSDAADSVSVKGVRLLINSAVPVVGGPLSELYGSVIGSMSLVRSTVGIFTIITVALITLPPLIGLLFWIFTLKALSAAGNVLLQKGISKLLDSLAGALTLMNVILIFNSALFIISTALIINTGVR